MARENRAIITARKLIRMVRTAVIDHVRVPRRALLDLRFLEVDVPARDRIVFPLGELVGHGARVLLGDVIEPGARARNELDLQGDGLGHGEVLFGSGGKLAGEARKSRKLRRSRRGGNGRGERRRTAPAAAPWRQARGAAPPRRAPPW